MAMNTPLNDNYVILPYADDLKVLLLRGNSGWTLPQHIYTESSDINRALKEQFGGNVTVLACVYDRYKDSERDDTHHVYALENHSANWNLPANARWVSYEELQDLVLAVPEHRAVLETWFRELEHNELPTQSLPWAHVGWFDMAVAWIHEQLSALGYRVNGPIEQLRVRIWSTVLRVPVIEWYEGAINRPLRTLYFKASAPVFWYEPQLTQALAELSPEHVPHVLAIDRTRHWMLIEDAGKTLREIMRNEEGNRSLEAMIPQFARFQMETSAHVEHLKALGCPDRRLNKVPELFEQLISDTSALLVGRKGGVPETEIETIRHFSPEVQAMCTALASYNIPETLHYDDLHTGNVLVQGDNYIFFDWQECAIAHPFYSMVVVLRVAEFILKYEPARLDRLRDIYLREWLKYEPMERLKEAFQLAHRLGKLSKAFSWHDIVSSLEEGALGEYEDAVSYWLRLFVLDKEDV